jgi:hypothetical protein
MYAVNGMQATCAFGRAALYLLLCLAFAPTSAKAKHMNRRSTMLLRANEAADIIDRRTCIT